MSETFFLVFILRNINSFKTSLPPGQWAWIERT